MEQFICPIKVVRFLFQHSTKSKLYNMHIQESITYITGHAVAQLVEPLKVCGFDSRWCHWNFSLTYSFRPHYGPRVDSASNRNEYQCVGLTILPSSCDDCLEFWVPPPTPGIPGACPVLYMHVYVYKKNTVFPLYVKQSSFLEIIPTKHSALSLLSKSNSMIINIKIQDQRKIHRCLSLRQ